MKSWTLAAALLFACTYGFAQSEQTASTARKPCEDLKTEISKKLDAKGVVGYTLDAVDKGKESSDAKVVGTCDGGTKSMVYTRSAAPAQPKATDEKKTQ